MFCIAVKACLITSQINTAPKLELEKLGNVREVIDNRNSRVSDEDCINQVKDSMAWLTSRGEFRFDAAIVIKKNGTYEMVLSD